MKVLLQNTKTRLYFREPDLWTSKSEKATEYRDTPTALRFCRQQFNADVQIVLKFDKEEYDIQLAVSPLGANQPADRPPP
jgi:hypothetical protein